MFDHRFSPPPFTELDKANIEIQNLYRLLHKEREILGRVIVDREEQKRSLKGSIDALAANNRLLRNKLDTIKQKALDAINAHPLLDVSERSLATEAVMSSDVKEDQVSLPVPHYPPSHL